MRENKEVKLLSWTVKNSLIVWLVRYAFRWLDARSDNILLFRYLSPQFYWLDRNFIHIVWLGNKTYVVLFTFLVAFNIIY